MCRKGAPCRRVLAVTAASALTWFCSPPGSTMSLKSLLTSSVVFSPALLRCHQCLRDVSLTSLGVPSHLRTGEAMNQCLRGTCSALISAMSMYSLLTSLRCLPVRLAVQLQRPPAWP